MHVTGEVPYAEVVGLPAIAYIIGIFCLVALVELRMQAGDELLIRATWHYALLHTTYR